ncbi:MAG: exodeoxyribonuclease VII small subunit [Firmicutes bacterium]|mgnify:CR=1 FL=1|nr:exodeoxyribonuclease VII small subunit [Bacillota bacterium]
MAKARRTKKRLSFEEAFERLEELTSFLEQGNLDLEETIKAFSEGKELLRYCEELLGEAEESLKIIDLNTGQEVDAEEEEK